MSNDSYNFGTDSSNGLNTKKSRSLLFTLITLGVIADHTGAIRSYERAGFRQEGRVTSLHFIDGQYRDKVLMGVTSDEFEQLTAP